MTAAVIVFPGSNRDRDMCLALKRATGKEPLRVWHQDGALPKADLIVLPGGFSYGDYLRCGAMAAHSPIMREVKAAAEKGTPVLAVCNGFQIAVEAGLLPGALISNAGLKFICRNVTIKVETSNSAFTRGYNAGQIVSYPVAHHDGNYVADRDTVKKLEDGDRIAFRYCDEAGRVAADTNLNGSVNNIAGILSESRTVLGLMPHPEDAVDPQLGGTDGALLFNAIAQIAS
jgi:phosphoribosylformylglycinamidine synthase